MIGFMSDVSLRMTKEKVFSVIGKPDRIAVVGKNDSVAEPYGKVCDFDSTEKVQTTDVFSIDKKCIII
jgi:hypothetical protein